MSGITITSEQRNALYEEIFVGLSGIGDVWLAADKADFDKATEFGRNYSDDLRLILDDLGWGEGSDDGPRAVHLSTPSDVLRRVLARLRDGATDRGERAALELSSVRGDVDHSRLVVETCDSALACIEAGEKK
jgi:hypothetical protein